MRRISRRKFKEYLGNQEIAHESSKTGSELWEERVTPGLKRIIIDTLEACSRQMKPAEKCVTMVRHYVAADAALIAVL